MSVWHDDYEIDFDGEEMQRVAQVDAFNDELQAAGAWVFGGRLQPASSATVLRATTADHVSMTDGPHAETKEHMGGFWVIEATDFDAALAWARKATIACEGPVELRSSKSERCHRNGVPA